MLLGANILDPFCGAGTSINGMRLIPSMIVIAATSGDCYWWWSWHLIRDRLRLVESYPVPVVNILNGGKHEADYTDFQESMIT
jgi:hypothetical protein